MKIMNEANWAENKCHHCGRHATGKTVLRKAVLPFGNETRMYCNGCMFLIAGSITVEVVSRLDCIDAKLQRLEDTIYQAIRSNEDYVNQCTKILNKQEAIKVMLMLDSELKDT